MKALKNGTLEFDADAFDSLYGVTLEEMYNSYSSSAEVETPVLVADNEGIYPDKMGNAASEVFEDFNEARK